MKKHRYFLKDPVNRSIIACITILEEDKKTFHRVITLTHPNMKLKRGESIKKELSKYSDHLIEDWVNNKMEKSTIAPEKFSDQIWGRVFDIWVWTYGIINVPEGLRFQKNCKLCNHEYRMIVSPDGRN